MKNNKPWTNAYDDQFWIDLARYARRKVRRFENQPTSLGSEDYAMQLISKLMALPADPGGKEAMRKWVHLKARTLMKDRRVRYGKMPLINAQGEKIIRKKKEKSPLQIEELSAILIDSHFANLSSMSTQVVNRELINQFLKSLSNNDYSLMEYYLQDYTPAQIARELGFKTGREVSQKIDLLLSQYASILNKG